MSKKTLPDELQGLIRATPGLARLARPLAPRERRRRRTRLSACRRPCATGCAWWRTSGAGWPWWKPAPPPSCCAFTCPPAAGAAAGQRPENRGHRQAGSGRRLDTGQAPASGPTLDAQSASHLRQAADYIEDPDLAAALRRLAGRADRG
ncbi:hypothetical protein HML84_08270 [Alcanivorax sp. IO_7]|nr:hypothetical protein HML84_08270 [Alcanivorax sp. IO_7]